MESNKVEVYFRYRLLTLMRKKEMTQKDLAIKSGLPEVTISRYLNGNRYPSIAKLSNLCEALGCMPNDLIYMGDLE